MNKILVDDTLHLKEDAISLLTIDKDIEIFCEKEDLQLYLLPIKNCHITLHCTTKTKVYQFSQGHKVVVTINLTETANLTYHLTTIASGTTTQQLKIYHQSPKTKSKVVCHGLSKDQDDLTFSVSGYIPKGMVGCYHDQKNQIITYGKGKGTIEPLLFIDEYEVEASHSAYIGPFQNSLIFYLQTKGIPKLVINKLLLEKFLKQDSQYEPFCNYIDTIFAKYANK